MPALDLAWANAAFALIALSYDYRSGIGQIPSTDHLFYRGQVLNLVNRPVRTSLAGITDSMVGTVATLCNLNIMVGNLPSAKVHMTDLEQMV